VAVNDSFASLNPSKRTQAQSAVKSLTKIGVAEWRDDFALYWTRFQALQLSIHPSIQQRPKISYAIKNLEALLDKQFF
jgi:hypothetical protein